MGCGKEAIDIETFWFKRAFAHAKAVAAQDSLRFALEREPALRNRVGIALLDHYIRQVGTEVSLFDHDEQTYYLLCGSIHRELCRFFRKSAAVMARVEETMRIGEALTTEALELRIALFELNGYHCCGSMIQLRSTPETSLQMGPVCEPSRPTVYPIPVPVPVQAVALISRLAEPARSLSPAPALGSLMAPIPKAGQASPAPRTPSEKASQERDFFQHDQLTVQASPTVRCA